MFRIVYKEAKEESKVRRKACSFRFRNQFYNVLQKSIDVTEEQDTVQGDGKEPDEGMVLAA